MKEFILSIAGCGATSRKDQTRRERERERDRERERERDDSRSVSASSSSSSQLSSQHTRGELRRLNRRGRRFNEMADATWRQDVEQPHSCRGNILFNVIFDYTCFLKCILHS
jgi:hypothetical protein